MRAIDADALIEFCAERWMPLNIDAVNMQPTIQPEPKEGHWIVLDTDSEKYDDIKCSECGLRFTVDACRWFDIGQTKEDFIYCPHCGTRMKGATT